MLEDVYYGHGARCLACYLERPELRVIPSSSLPSRFIIISAYDVIELNTNFLLLPVLQQFTVAPFTSYPIDVSITACARARSLNRCLDRH